MKKKGSILIEVMVSIMILSLTTTFIVSTCIDNEKKIRERILSEEVNRTICNLINEFKYNISRKDIDEILSYKKIGFKYDKDLSKKLIDQGIKDLEKGNDIEIFEVEEDEKGLKLRVVANIKAERNEVTVEKEFTKSWWMDEV